MSLAEAGSAKAWILAFFVVAGVGIGGLVGIGCLVGANVCPGKSTPPLTTTNGKVIFEVRCALCHGIDGRGGRAPSLVSGRLGELSADELVPRITNGKRLAGMPKFEGVLTGEQIRAVAGYVVGLRRAS